jgi:integrase
MEFVEPIRDTKKIAQIKNLLRGQGRHRDLLLFIIGINTALRISDILELRIGQFVDDDGEFVNSFQVDEKKTKKHRKINVNDAIRAALKEFIAAYPTITDNPNHYLFFNTKSGEFNEPVKRGIVWRMIAQICKDVGLRGNYGTHSLRKTWGYQARMNGVDLILIMKTLNHSDLDETKRYLGITDDELAEIANKLNL